MAAHQAPPSLGFSRQEHWSGLPFPSPCMKVKSESEVTESCCCTTPYTMRNSSLGLCRCSGSEDRRKKSIELFCPALFSKGEKISRKLLMYFVCLSESFSLWFYSINTFGGNSKIFGVYKNIVSGWPYFVYYGQFLLTSCLLLNLNTVSRIQKQLYYVRMSYWLTIM